SCHWHHNLTAAVCSFRTAKALRTNPGSRHAIPTFLWPNSVKFKGDKAMIYSESRNIGTITIGDVDQSNGVIHVIDTVMVPK
ncbi:MAG: fasciclin domain-containing protein, partial [Tabrizicola sp.]